MKKDIKDYTKRLEKDLKKDLKAKEKEDIKTELLERIPFYQHERMVHLVVTFFVGIVCIAFLLAGMVMKDLLFFIPFFITFILFFIYITNYYYMEGHVLYLYKMYDKLNEK